MLNQHEAATYLRISERSLERYRVKGGGPLYAKCGRRILYRKEALDAWVKSHERANTSQEVA